MSVKAKTTQAAGAGRGVTYGIKKESSSPGGKPFLLTTDGNWISARFVGLGSCHGAKEWKTARGAQQAAIRYGGEVFTITETMNYEN